MLKTEEVNRSWYTIDAAGRSLGRVAVEAAKLLRGKHKPRYTPHVDCGDHVIILNAGKVALTGNKLEQKSYKYHTGHVGGLKEVKYSSLMKNKPSRVVELAVKGMLPNNCLGRKSLTRLRVYPGEVHDHVAQKPVEWVGN